MKSSSKTQAFIQSIKFKYLMILCISINFFQTRVIAQSTNDPTEILNLINNNFSTLPIQEGKIDSFIRILGFLKKYHIENKNSGQISFGLDANSSKLSSLSRVQTGIKYKFGYFPYNVDVIAQLQTDYRNGELEESISNIDISYDFHLKKRNDAITSQRDLVYEAFVYLNRSSNSYIGLESKYEVGGGFIFNFWSGFGNRGTTVNGSLNKGRLTAFADISQNKNEKTIVKNYDALKIKYPILKALTDEQKEALSTIYEDVWLSNIKSYSRLRLAVLVGLFNEIEKVIIFDSVRQSDNSLFYPQSISYPATSKWRITLRPTVYFNLSDEIRIKLLPYFKFSPIEFNNVVSYEHEGNLLIDRKQDYVWNVVGEINFRVTPYFSTGIQYTNMYINAPNRNYILDNYGVPVLFMGQKQHKQVKINFTYEFK